ncbi:MAG: hypothetical protein R3Y10_09780 [Ferrimonas sp.]
MSRCALHYVIACALQRGIGFVLLPLSGHLLSATAFGQMGLLTALANGLSIVAGLGLAETAQRFGHRPNYWASIEATAGRWFCCWLLGLPLMPMMAAWLPGVLQPWWLWMLWLNLGLGALLGLRLMQLRWLGCSAAYLKLVALWALGQLSGSALALGAGWGVGGMMAMGLVATAMALFGLQGGWVVQLSAQARHIKKPLWSLLRYGLPLCACSALALVFAGYERWWLAQYEGVVTLSGYVLMGQLALLPIVLTEPFNLWWFPKRFALAAREQRNTLAEYSVGAIQGLAIATLLLGWTLPWLVTWLLPAHFADALPLLPGLLLASFWRQCAAVINFGVYYQVSGHLPLLLNALVALPALGLVPWVIATAGSNGLVPLLVGLMVVRAGLFWWVSQRCYALPYHAGRLGGALGLTCIVLWLQQPWAYLISIGGVLLSVPWATLMTANLTQQPMVEELKE